MAQVKRPSEAFGPGLKLYLRKNGLCSVNEPYADFVEFRVLSVSYRHDQH